MATLISRDTSGVLQAQAGETEDLRTRGAKRFLVQTLPDGRKQYRVGASIGPLHYKRDPFDEAEPWQEIDLDLVPVTGKGWQWECDTNGYGVRVWQRYTMAWRYACEFRRAGEWVRMAPVRVQYANDAGETQTIGEPRKNLVPTVDNEANRIEWRDCFGKGLHFRYNLRPDEFFKTLTIDNADALPAATIGTEGLRVEIVMALAWSGQAGNGFGKGKDLTVLTGLEDADEERGHRFAKHAHKRQDGREALWMQEPRAWDAEGEALPMEWGLERKGKRVWGVFGVDVAALECAAWPVYVDTAISEEQVGASSDDGYSRGSTWPGTGGSYAESSLTSTAPVVGKAGQVYYMVGFRFTTVPIPNGATIDTASISVKAGQTQTTVVNWLVAGEDADNPSTFGASHYPLHAYAAATTNKSETWTPPNWAAGSWNSSPDIASVVAEITTRVGWSEDNAIVILLYPATSTEDTSRTIRNYDYTGNVSGPKFNCTYTEASSGETVTATRALSVFASGTTSGTRDLAAFGSADASATRALEVSGAALVTALRSLAASGSADADTTRALETYAADVQAAVRDLNTYGAGSHAATRAAEAAGYAVATATRLLETWASEGLAAQRTAEAWAEEVLDATRTVATYGTSDHEATRAVEVAGAELASALREVATYGTSDHEATRTVDVAGADLLAALRSLATFAASSHSATRAAEVWGTDAAIITVTRALAAYGADVPTASRTAETYGIASLVVTRGAEVYGLAAASALREVALWGADTQAASRTLSLCGEAALSATRGFALWAGTFDTQTALRDMQAWGAALLAASRTLAVYGADGLAITRGLAATGADTQAVTRTGAAYGTATDTATRQAQVYAQAASSALRTLALWGSGPLGASRTAEVWGWALNRNFTLRPINERFTLEPLPERFTLTPLGERFTLEPIHERFTLTPLPKRFTLEVL